MSDNVLQDGDVDGIQFCSGTRNRTIHSQDAGNILYELKHNEQLETSILPVGMADGELAADVKTERVVR